MRKHLAEADRLALSLWGIIGGRTEASHVGDVQV